MTTHLTKWEALTAPTCPATFTPEQLTAVRAIRGWTQAELGRRIGVPRATVNKWERGKGRIDQRTCMAIRFAVVYHDL
jgi:transcriptional regulator with XRE-family HTH domain